VDINIIQVNKGFSPLIYPPGSFFNIGLYFDILFQRLGVKTPNRLLEFFESTR